MKNNKKIAFLGTEIVTSRSQLYDTSHRAQLLTTFIQFRRTFDATLTLNRLGDYSWGSQSPLHVLKAQQFHFASE